MHDHEHEHTYTHSHPHDHEPGEHTHDHSHTHDHEHSHEHAHTPAASGVAPEERTRALLAYMIDHNAHHVSELSELVDGLGGAARERLLEAIGGFEAANAQLREVLELIKEE